MDRYLSYIGRYLSQLEGEPDVFVDANYSDIAI